MHVRIWPLMLALAVIAGCAAPPPAEEAPSASPEAASDGVLAGEGFESGRSETLEPAVTPAAAEQAE